MQNDQKRLIIVLGMHRSGTSAMTRSLQALGVDLGSQLLGPHEAVNPKGFFEDTKIVEFNEELLKKIGTDWHSITAADYNQIADQKNQLMAEARELLDERFKETDIFGIKDPRIAILLPFWKPVFEFSGYRTSYLVACRNPLSVAKSLEERDNFKTTKSLYLWLKHNLSIFSCLLNDKFTVVDFDQLIDEPEKQLQRIASGLNLQVNQQKADAFCSEFLEQKLRHSTFSLEDLRQHSGIPESVYETYKLLLQLSEDIADTTKISSLVSLSERIWLDLQPAFQLMKSYQTDFSRELSEQKQQSEQIQDQIRIQMQDQLQQTSQKFTEELDEKNHRVGALENELNQIRTQLKESNDKNKEILSSRSWKLTEPLRKMAEVVRKN